MRLKKIELKDFRSFYGPHTIELESKANSPITLFIGENGSGKTTLMNAIHWVLTDKCTARLSNPASLVNKDAMREGRRECSVSLEIHDESGTLFSISRSKSSDHQHSTLRVFQNVEGSFKPLKADDSTFLSRFFPSTLAQWFIFDGEALGEMNLSGSIPFKKDLQQAFGFDALETLRDDLTALVKQYESEESRRKKDASIDRLSEEIENKENLIEASKKSLAEEVAKFENNAKLEQHYSAELTKLAPSAELQRRRQRADADIKSAQASLKRKCGERNLLVGASAAAVMLSRPLSKLEDVFATRTEKQSIPSPYSERLIDDILQVKKCICGRPLIEDSDEHRSIMALVASASTSVLNHRIAEVRSKVTALKINAASFRSRWDSLGTDISEAFEAEAIAKQQFDAADASLKRIDEDEVKKLEEKREHHRSLTIAAAAERRSLSDLIDRAEEDLRKLREQRTTLLNSSRRDAAIVTKLTKLDKLVSRLKSEISRQETEVLKVLSDELSEILRKYLTKNFTVKVHDKNYRVEVFDTDGTPADLSTGEWVLVKLAFVATMVGMAANRTQIASVNWVSDPVVAPLVLDSPFSVLDSEYRLSTAINLAAQVQQLVLMTSKDPWAGLGSKLEPKISGAYLVESYAKGPQKEVQKLLEWKGKSYPMNFYGAERDESRLRRLP